MDGAYPLLQALSMALPSELRNADQNHPLEENSLPCMKFLQKESLKSFAGLYQIVPWCVFQKESEASDGVLDGPEEMKVPNTGKCPFELQHLLQA